jgi:hypothetical protein
LTFSPDASQTGWVGSKASGISLHDSNLHVGAFQGESFAGVLQFDLQSLLPDSRILFAALEITGRRSANLGSSGEWVLNLLDSNQLKLDELTYDALRQAAPLSTIGGPLASQNLAAGLTNRFLFAPKDLALIEKQLNGGILAFRLAGPTDGDNLFTWNAGPGSGGPILYIVTIPAPFTVITTTPTPPNVFAAATLVARQTAQARDFGTPTPLPRSFITATPGPDYVVITSVPTPVSATARTATALYATAVAATTGTFTPLPFNWITATPQPLLIPREALTPRPTATPSSVRPSDLDLAKMPMPPGLFNRIAFLEGPRETPNVWVMDPDGSNVALLTNRIAYDIAKARDTLSPDGVYYVYQENDLNGQLQLWIRDLNFPSVPLRQLSFVRRGVIYGQAWSPDGRKVAYVTDETERHEIYVWDWDARKSTRLTFSTDWWWNQFPSWSPDGKQIVFSSDRGHIGAFSEIWVMNSDGTNARYLGNEIWDAYNPVWIKWQR